MVFLGINWAVFVSFFPYYSQYIQPHTIYYMWYKIIFYYIIGRFVVVSMLLSEPEIRPFRQLVSQLVNQLVSKLVYHAKDKF